MSANPVTCNLNIIMANTHQDRKIYDTLVGKKIVDLTQNNETRNFKKCCEGIEKKNKVLILGNSLTTIKSLEGLTFK